MTNPIDVIGSEIQAEFEMFGDWMEKYEYLIELGKSLPIIAETYKDEAHLIKGCQSRVWLHAELQKGKIDFTADSDAIITKGIIALMVRALSGQNPKDIVTSKLDFIDQIGLKEHLSPTRSNGLVSMIKQMKYYAIAIESQNVRS